MKLIAVALLVLFLSVSCSNNSDKKSEITPANLLNKNKMAAVLTDISLMEAAINSQTNPTANPDSTLKFNLYKQHMVSREQYESSLKYYSSHPTEFKEVYDLVLQNLNQQKGN